MSFNNTADASGKEFALIPDKTLVKAVLTVQEPKQGKPRDGIQQCTQTGGKFINLVATVAEGPYTKRKVFGILCTLPDGSEGHRKWYEGARETVANALEQIQGAHKENNPGAYCVGTPQMEHAQVVEALVNILNGKEVVINIRVAKGKDGYDDKNDFKIISRWGTYFKKYEAGDNQPALPGTAPAPTAIATPAGFGSTPQPAPVQNQFAQPAPGFVDAVQDDAPPY